MTEGTPATGLGRLAALLIRPRATWQAIDADPGTARALVVAWVLPLAAIGPLAAMVGELLVGHDAGGIRYRPTLSGALLAAGIRYAMAVITVLLLAWVIALVARAFGGRRDRTRAMALATFSAVPALLSGIFGLDPKLGGLSVIGAYGLYLLYVGAPILMKPAENKRVPHAAVSVVTAALLVILMITATSAVQALLVPHLAVITTPGAGGTISIT